MAKVNPEILKWARETAGMSLAEAAQTLGIKDARGKAGTERLVELETGRREPTRPQLVKMSQKYRRSLLVFYLDAPPRQGDRGEDFRRLPNAPQPEYNATLDTLIRDVRARQSLVRSLLEDDETPQLDFIGSIRIDESITKVTSKIKNTLGFQRGEYQQQRSVEDAFNYLREKIEDAGIFVLLMGNLGSYHSTIPVEEFRGFALSDPIAPFIVINDQDARSAWSFTALHEVVHTFWGLTGISDPYSENRIERFCNEVASEILLPKSELTSLAVVKSLPFDMAVAEITSFAQTRRLNRSMVAYKLYLMDRLAGNQWNQMNLRFKQEWLKLKKERAAESSHEGGPSYYLVKRHRLGQSLLSLIRRALGEGSITYTKAGKVLGVKPRNVEPLLRINIPY